MDSTRGEKITAVVLTKDEGLNIADCLNSISWCDEIILIDDSRDQTVEITKQVLRPRVPRIVKNSVSDDFSALRNLGKENIEKENYEI